MKNLLFTLLIASTIPLSTSAFLPAAIVNFQEKDIHPKDLPENIRKYVTDNYNGAAVTKASVKDTGASSEYTVEINYNRQKVILKFDHNGQFVRKE
jgi:hypothetical protein